MNTSAELICDLALADEGTAPDWVHLLPRGQFTARDGRMFDNSDSEAVIATFRQRKIDLPIDYEHQNDRAEARLSGPVPAAGWIDDLELRSDGIWGRTKWTARARDLITRREYRYLSPTVNVIKKTGRIVLLKGAGLVHSRALHLTALAKEEEPMPEDELIAKIADALGLPPGSTADDVMTFIRRFRGLLAKVTGDAVSPAQMRDLDPAALTPDPAKFVPIATVQAMLSERNTTLATITEERAEARVKDAMARGYLSPAMRGWALALCKSDEASFEEFLGKSIPHFASVVGAAPITTSAKPPPVHLLGLDDSSRGRSEEEMAICAQLGLDPAEF